MPRNNDLPSSYYEPGSLSPDSIYHNRGYGDKGSQDGLFELADTQPSTMSPTTPIAHYEQPHFQDYKRAADPNGNGTLSARSRENWQADYLDKSLLLAAVFVPLLVSIGLVISSVILNQRSTGPLLTFTNENRATTQIIVSIVSLILASLNVYTVTQVINLATRIHLLGHAMSLDTLKFISSVTTRQLATGVPLASWMLSVIMMFLLMVPGILWIGALTPLSTTTNILVPGTLKIPQYSASSNSTWGAGGQIVRADCNVVLDFDKGTFSDCTAETIQASLISRSSQGTSDNRQSHMKNDNSRYSYIGSRSFGVGASPGLTDQSLYDERRHYDVLFYNYTEPGYLTSVSCFRNDTSTFELDLVYDDNPEGGAPSTYNAVGTFPYADSEDHFMVVGMGGDDSIAVMTAKTYAGHNQVLMAAGKDYTQLDKVQCSIEFKPTTFEVLVDPTKKTIGVSPANDTTTTFDVTLGLANTTINQINSLGMTAVTLYTSTLGDAFMTNINRTITNDKSANAPFTAIAGSFEAIVDDILNFIGSSQFFLPGNGTGDFSTVEISMTVSAVRLGAEKYVIAACAMCFVLLAAVAVEAIRTQMWKWLPQWDYNDTTCLVLASAVAGDDLVGDVCLDGRPRQGDKLHGNEATAYEGGVAHKMDEKWVDGASYKGSDVRIRLGKKALGSVQQGHDDDRDDWHLTAEGREVRVTAVSLWTTGARNVMPLR